MEGYIEEFDLLVEEAEIAVEVEPKFEIVFYLGGE
jgi:hypothetical protein